MDTNRNNSVKKKKSLKWKIAVSKPTESDSALSKGRFTCDVCDKSYGKKYTLDRHVRESHHIKTIISSNPSGEESNILIPSVEKFICNECGKCFIRKFTLNRHILTKHPDTPLMPSSIAQSTSRSVKRAKESSVSQSVKSVKEPSASRNVKSVKLPSASRAKSAKVPINKIKIEIIGNPIPSTSEGDTSQSTSATNLVLSEEGKYSCPHCKFKCNLKNIMETHYSYIHKYEVNMEELFTFKDFEVFGEWKNKMCSETASKFYIRRSKTTLTGQHIYFNCHRDGQYKSKGKGIRYLQGRTSRKIDAHCPARIYLHIEEDGLCSVMYCRTHVGHEANTTPLTFTAEEKKMITKKRIKNIVVSTEILAKRVEKILKEKPTISVEKAKRILNGLRRIMGEQTTRTVPPENFYLKKIKLESKPPNISNVDTIIKDNHDHKYSRC